MSAPTEVESSILTEYSWGAGAISGIAGAAVMGGLILVMNPPTLAVAMPSLYGLAPPASVAAGLVVDIIHGAVLGVVFSSLVEATNLDSRTGVVVGIAWGVLTWLGFASILMPIWLGAVGSPASPPFPNFALPSLLWHLVYGAVLGGVYAVSRDSI